MVRFKTIALTVAGLVKTGQMSLLDASSYNERGTCHTFVFNTTVYTEAHEPCLVPYLSTHSRGSHS